MTTRPAGALIGAAVALSLAAASAEERKFSGLSALVVRPENSWSWDSAIFGALEERGFQVAYGPLPGPASLAKYDVVALSIKRTLTPAEAANLAKYVRQGGTVYGSWGGPFDAKGFAPDVCKVAGIRSLRLRRIVLLDSPLASGIDERKLDLALRVGHQAIAPGSGSDPGGWEIVAVKPLAGGIPVATDPAGNVLGVLARHGRGRTAILGFGPEQDKYLARRELAGKMLDNLLAWLLAERLQREPTSWPGLVTVSLPARTRNVKVLVDGRPIARPPVRQVGSLAKLNVPVKAVAQGRSVTVTASYDPLAPARNVETVIHLPWNTLRSAAASPARLAGYLASLNATVCQPLLRGSFGHAWYKGMPQDRHDDKLVKQYQGDFLADLVGECRRRGIRVVGGIYLDNAAAVRADAELKRLDRQGKPVKDRYGRAMACFNNPKAREHSLATVEDLLKRYKLDGIMLDDNFELDGSDCYCAYCKAGFRRYCAAHGMAYQDPGGASGGKVAPAWRAYRQECTRTLAGEFRKVARARGVPAGGWVGVGMDATHLAGALDVLGGMVYSTPPRSARGPLSVLGRCRFLCLLWAPDTPGAALEAEARQAVHAGCAAIGFWVRGKDGGYEMDAETSAAIRRAFAAAEGQWLDYYRDSLLSGDGRFVIAEGKVTARSLTLTLRNTGRRVTRRIAGRIDLSALSGGSPGKD